METIKIKLYRHKCFEDIYLARNYMYYGGHKDTPFYYATKDIMEAIISAHKENFLDWHKRIDGLTAKITDSKEIDIDGYMGTVTKELCFPVSEFEVVFLEESVNKQTEEKKDQNRKDY